MTEDLTSYLEGTLPSDRAAALEAHLAHCDACRADFVAARRALQPSHRWPIRLLGGALLAAALLVGIPSLWSRLGQVGPSGLERGEPAPVAPLVSIAMPADGAPVPAGAVQLIWRSVGADVQYRVTVTDSAGGRIWSAERPDTTLTLDATLLSKASSYYWFVDALLADGRTRTSGTHRFSTPP
jgi:hypothetical protein